ncbi:MAG: TRAP transporter substrate-binding protein DctP [Desulfobacterales bacterium]|jgi:TRAP-type transport system periplasmic protein|nr:TRAP transporter substrate-binding protein DctP [Desulfobacteraceae bacterium]MBT7085467.1 TRAP transporter substrate-binding protein DctP [Desulfobacterales bacterium]MBT7696109.1 TRAP transporter substrate-binding protein DctP [Desulfobacterales bacterium]
MLQKKKTIIHILIIAIFSGIIFTHTAEAKDNKSDKKFRIKLASLAPKNIGWARHIREIIHPEVKKATDNNVRLKWFWGGTMGNDVDYIQKMSIGQLQGAAFTGYGVTLVCPEMSVLGLPFMFNNYDEVDYIREKMMSTFDSYVEKRGYKLIVWADQDFDQIYSVKYKFNKLENFKRALIVTWYGPMEQMLLSELGSSPVPMNVTEITPSIRQGVADTLIAPAIWIIGSQLHSVIKHVNPVKIRYSPAAVFVTLDAFNNLPEEYQKGIIALRGKPAVEFREKTRADSAKAFKVLVTKGKINKTEMETEEFNKLKKKSKTVWNKMAGSEFPKELLDELLSHLAEFRAKEKK